MSFLTAASGTSIPASSAASTCWALPTIGGSLPAPAGSTAAGSTAGASLGLGSTAGASLGLGSTVGDSLALGSVGATTTASSGSSVLAGSAGSACSGL